TGKIITSYSVPMYDSCKSVTPKPDGNTYKWRHLKTYFSPDGKQVAVSNVDVPDYCYVVIDIADGSITQSQESAEFLAWQPLLPEEKDIDSKKPAEEPAPETEVTNEEYVRSIYQKCLARDPDS